MVLHVGDVLPEVEAPKLDRLRLAYMAVSMRDPNLVHMEDDYAARSGLPGVIAHGTFVVSYAGAAVSRVVGVDAIKRLKVDVTGPVFLGDVLRTRAEVVDVEPSADGELLRLNLTVSRDDGQTVGRGEAVVVQRSR